ncbi:peroxidase [Marchantia polymorpha subsp. ruderalis]|uniref:Peroxidase n=2 Tax=Marchantia polymorpha TaxID=3197 RepID=A0AAF6BJ88_MARPO|nr:hypothetical protein MARPO_0196s0013 [Marchantia polymorpha]BBN12072.1 hypothetical protein Mp_5g17110 [Marchantia polymorpha subsp. ruderalis]|eukprot:PTQ27501.1 hypothetical protein MARPO_0196s0013 [Marchantia polymorpha]
MGSKCLVWAFGTLLLLAATADAQLSTTFYNSRCRNLTAKVDEIIRRTIRRDRTLAPALLRLHFHDCFVRGCDASVLLNSPRGGQGEKEAIGNKDSLRGFQVIDDVKNQIEAMCPGVVSCADILALSARDSMRAFGGITWSVPLGRRDGIVTSAAEANRDLPPPFANFNTLSTLFNGKGLSDKDMVILSGAHTVGFARCASMQTRLYSFSAANPTDPTIDPTFAAQLKRQCPQGDNTTLILNDQTKPSDTWDFNYYSNVLRSKSLFGSDDAMKRNAAARKIVLTQNKPGSPFSAEFANAMEKMGRIGVLTGRTGQIRKICTQTN